MEYQKRARNMAPTIQNMVFGGENDWRVPLGL